MLNGRYAHGIVVWKRAVHVFGSCLGDEGRLCESLDITAWTALPKMHHMRAYFTPVVWQEAVYLCGGHINTIEVYDGVSMELLPLRLPERSATMACAKGETLLMITERHSTLLSGKKNTFSDASLTVKKLAQLFYSNSSSPVWWGSHFYLCSDSKILKYSVEDCRRLD